MKELFINTVANEFFTTMEEEGFDTFEEMKNCYWWTSEDIKSEVACIVREISTVENYMFDDMSEFMLDGEIVSYRKFMSNVYSKIRTMRKSA